MLSYQLYQAQADVLRPWRSFAQATSTMLRQFEGSAPNPLLRPLISACEMMAHAQLGNRRPSFGIDSVRLAGQNADGPATAVHEVFADQTPFGKLLHFRKATELVQPKVLIVAPMSGHFATLLAPTVKTMLPEHDVYITDWQNARDIPLQAGPFGFDDYVDHIIRFLRVLGPGAHVMAVCQPAVPVLAAAAVMAEQGDPCRPRSMTLMAGPIDTRVSPTKVNELAVGQKIEWFNRELIDTVPWPAAGAGRRVYPGYVQLTAFMSMNLQRHINAHVGQFRHLLGGNKREVEAHNLFYDEYLAVMDLPAEFFLDTVERIFQRHDLPLGRLTHHGALVRPELIKDTALLTVEGERDDICALGQTRAALDLCSGLPAAMKHHHVQAGVGHYGVFGGRRWHTEIFPKVQALIAQAGSGHH
jgi:poly(3-hydroxybutyrate) depolymerase